MSSTPETFNKPCPERILHEFGDAFAFGAIGGSFFHFIRSCHNSPQGQRFHNGLTAVRMNAPRIGGELAVFWGLESACECTMVSLRQKEDPWNSIISGSVAFGLLEVRRGIGRVATGAVVGGCLFALLEGAGIMLTRYLGEKKLPQVISSDDGPPLAKFGEVAEKKWSFFDSTEGLESFDSPEPPTFDF